MTHEIKEKKIFFLPKGDKQILSSGKVPGMYLAETNIILPNQCLVLNSMNSASAEISSLINCRNISKLFSFSE